MGFRTLALVAGGAASLMACASGSDGRNRDEPIRALMSADALMFVSFDTDANLTVSAEEIEAGIVREFARADANSDGNLAPIEFQNWANSVLGGGQMGPYRLDFDRNVDNTISNSEFVTEVRSRVRDYDENTDGALTRGEFVRLIGITRPPRDRPQPGTPGLPPAGRS
jgi:hypothetical protein